MKAWHFSNGMTLRDGKELIEGKTYIYEGEIQICKSGYHASKKVSDALNYAPGFTLSLVDCEGIVEEHEHKFVCSSRKVLKILDVKNLILLWSADAAEDALKNVENPDVRSVDAIKAIRDFVNGKISKEEMRKASSYAYDAWNTNNAYAVRSRWSVDACATRDAARAVVRASAYAAWSDDTALYIEVNEKYSSWLSERIEKEFGLI